MDYYGGTGVFNACGHDITIRNNEIAFCSYTGIGSGWGWSTRENVNQNIIIAYNDIHHTSMFLCDTAGIYTLNAQRGSQIRYNYIHDVQRSKFMPTTMPAFGIYLDEGTNYMVCSDNVVRNTHEWEYMIFTHKTGINNYVMNNTTYNKEIMDGAGVSKFYSPISLKKTVSGTSFIENMSLGHVVNKEGGDAGFSITMKADKAVKGLGRFFVLGNSQVHKLKIIDAANENVVAETFVDMGKGRIDYNGFKYGLFNNSVKLTSGKTYYIVSEEAAGGDLYADKESRILFDSSIAEVGTYVFKKTGTQAYIPPAPKANQNMGGLNILFA